MVLSTSCIKDVFEMPKRPLVSKGKEGKQEVGERVHVNYDVCSPFVLDHSQKRCAEQRAVSMFLVIFDGRLMQSRKPVVKQ